MADALNTLQTLKRQRKNDAEAKHKMEIKEIKMESRK
jgi:hypothetical protein